MSTLELRVPPLVVVVIVVAAMVAGAAALPAWTVNVPGHRAIAAALLAAGFAIALAGVLAFARARTTADPRASATESALVVGGIYRLTRNPMYLGFALALTALAVWLRHPPALLGPVAFVAYIDRFQIRPEERRLEARFGEAFRAYARRVRRWI